MLGMRRHGHGGSGGEEAKKEKGSGEANTTAGAGTNQWGNLGFGFESTGNIESFTEGVMASKGRVTSFQITGGGSAVLALMENGDVWAAGGNNLGICCDGTFLNKPQGVKTMLKEVQQLVIGGNAGYALHTDGSVSSWGSNGEGQLGNGHDNAGSEVAGKLVAKNEPYPLYPLGSGVVELAACGATAGAVFADGHVDMWGDNRTGQVGNGSEDLPEEHPQNTPITVWPLPGHTLTTGEHAVELAIGAVAKGNGHSMLRRKDGRLMAWGGKGNAESGIEPFTSGKEHNLLVPTIVPNEELAGKPHEGGGGTPLAGVINVVKIIMSDNITFTINTSNELYVFGSNEVWGSGLGYIGSGGVPKSKAEWEAEVASRGAAAVVAEEWAEIIYPPRKVHSNVAAVGVEQNCLGVALNTGALLTCGRNGQLQLGRGEPADQYNKAGHIGVPSLAAASGVVGAEEVSISIEAIVARCESCTIKSFYHIYGKKRAIKQSWISAVSEPWIMVLKKLAAPSEYEEEEGEGETPLPGSAQFNRRFSLFLKQGSDANNGLVTVPAYGTLSETLSTGAATTKLKTNSLAVELLAGEEFKLSAPPNIQIWKTTAKASVGAKEVLVVSQTPNFAYVSTTSLEPLFTTATGKTAIAPAEIPTLSPKVEDSSMGHRSEALFDLTTPDGKDIENEFKEKSTLHVVKFKFYGDPGIGSPQLGLEWLNSKSEAEGTLFETPIIGTLSAALTTGGAITELKTTALSSQIAKETIFQITDGAGHTQAWETIEKAATKSTKILVVSQTPNFAYPTTTKVELINDNRLKWPTSSGVKWYQQKVSNAVRPNITSAILKALRVFAYTGGASTWNASQIYAQLEFEYPPDPNPTHQTEPTGTDVDRAATAKEWKSKPLEPGDLYSFKVSGGPANWPIPLGFATIQGIRKPADLKTKKLTSGELQIEAFGATGSFTISGQPAGAKINASTGAITWTLTGGIEASKAVTVKAAGRDEEGEVWEDEMKFNWQVTA